MGRPAAPARTLLALRLLQTSCGLLVAASLVALSQPTPTIVAHDGAVTVARAQPAVPTEWSGGGPLAIPTIGVVPPGMENWFDPAAEPTFVAPDAPLPTALVPPSATEEPVPAADEQPAPPAEATPPPTSSAVEPTIPTTPPTEASATDTLPTNDPEASTAPATTTEPTTTTTAPATSEPPATTTATATTTEPATNDSQASSPPTTTAAPATSEPPTTTTPPATSEPPATSTAPTTTAPAATPEEPAPTPPAPETNERGNVVLAFEQELTVFDDETGAVAFAIAVDGVSFDVACTGPASPPAANGSLVAVQLRVTTGPDLSTVGGEPAVRAADFHFLGPDGMTLTAAGTPSAAGCVPGNDLFPADPAAADQVLTGVVVIDVPPTTGTLVFAPDFLPVGAEWEYGPPPAG